MVRTASWMLLCALLLSACGARPSPLPPEEVLHRSAVAAQTKDSSRYGIEGTLGFSGMLDGGGSFRIDSVTSDGGRLVQADTDLSLALQEEENDRNIHAVFRILFAQDGSAYLRISDLNIGPADANVNTRPDHLLGTWWMLGAPPGKGDTPVAPSPRLLQAQANVVSVDRDHGLEKRDGAEVYHYSVHLDPERLVAFAASLAQERGESFDLAMAQKEVKELDATGELWIDATTFLVHRAEWTLPALKIADGALLRLVFAAELADMRGAPEITLPERPQPLSPGVGFFGSSLEGFDGASSVSTMIRDQSDSAVFPPLP